MVLLDNVIYKETKRIALGKSKRSPMLIEFSDWFLKTYSMKPLNIEFSKLKYPKANRYRLYVIIENAEDHQKMYVQTLKPNEEYQRQIASEFQKIALKYHFASKAQLENLFVIYNDFSQEAKTEANRKATSRLKWLAKFKYSAVWDVISMFTGTVVFYYSDVDIVTNENNGLSKSITNDYYSILKKYDELNYYTRENISLKFDSKENLDKNYKGSLFYYTR